MATARLWWDGSSWVTSSTYWVNKATPYKNQLGVHLYVRITAYDDATIKLSAWAEGYQTEPIYFSVGMSYNNIAFKTGTTEGSGTSLGTGSISDKDITSYSAINFKGDAQSYGTQNYQTSYSDAIGFNGHTTYNSSTTTPFYTVTYNANGGSGAPSSNKGVKGFSTKVANGTPTRSGWTFKGWATSNTATSATYQAGDTIPARSPDLTLYAVWYKNITITAPEGVTISFGGTNYTNQTVTVQKAYGTYALSMTAQSGWIIKTRSPAASVTQVVITKDGTTPSNISAISATSQRVGCHIDNGTQWVQAVMYLDTGSEWVMVQAYYDDGSSWKLVY